MDFTNDELMEMSTDALQELEDEAWEYYKRIETIRKFLLLQ